MEGKRWNLWDYEDINGRVILIYFNSGNSPDQSDIDEMGYQKVHIGIQNTNYDKIKSYYNEFKDKVDKVLLDITNIDTHFSKIENLFN